MLIFISVFLVPKGSNIQNVKGKPKQNSDIPQAARMYIKDISSSCSRNSYVLLGYTQFIMPNVPTMPLVKT